jgi:hypothetical protein
MNDMLISIPVDADLAEAYQSASIEEQKKIQLLLRLRLRELTDSPRLSLQQIMREIAEEAQRNGLTEEMLEDLLRDE